jgi:hypothetical protein
MHCEDDDCEVVLISNLKCYLKSEDASVRCEVVENALMMVKVWTEDLLVLIYLSSLEDLHHFIRT